MTPKDQAKLVQEKAGRPDLSVILNASAGSGKTHALINRFLRLCIEGSRERFGGRPTAPASPRSVLAITFTRKAAVEIKSRLVERALALATVEPAELERMLRDLFENRRDPAPTPGEIERAAGLYERVLENPSGLKVGTIHHFCQLILGRFAAEAGLDPRFTVVEDPDELIDEALDLIEGEMAADGDLARASVPLGKDPVSVRKALREVFTEQMRLQRWMVRAADPTDLPARRLDVLPKLLGEIQAALFPDLGAGEQPGYPAFLARVTAELEAFAGSGLDAVLAAQGADDLDVPAQNTLKIREAAEDLLIACRDQIVRLNAAGAGSAAVEAEAAALIERVQLLLLKKDGGLRVFWRGKDEDRKLRYHVLVAQAAGGLLQVLREVAYLDIYRKNRALLHLGLRALDLYDDLKRRDRVVDFQDLEDMARRLMGSETRAMSMLFRLDDSITHILVDEYQDTNFNQRDILEPLVTDFLGGGSEQTAAPTVFFVGDAKQSIYGFRGAEPGIFARYTEEFEELGRGQDPETVITATLPANFRSLGAIVDAVGTLFRQGRLGDALGPEGRKDVVQQVVRDRNAGTVLLVPPIAGDGVEGGRDGDQIAAEAAAAWVRDLMQDPPPIREGQDDARERPLEYKDILVLVRSRTGISTYEDAFRRAGIPISPSGRGMLASSREVQDLLALLRWLSWPDDDVALATVLRSPLFRLTDAQLQQALVRRGLTMPDGKGGFLPPKGFWATLRKVTGDPVITGAVELLESWRNRVGFDTCHDLLRRIYRDGHVLERFGEALGPQAVYNLLRMFDLALGPEVSGTPTVRRLADLIQRADSRGGQEEGAVPQELDGGRVRFMTIHGAKGLQASVVLLVDADRKSGKESPRINLVPGCDSSPLVFKVNKKDRTGFDLPGEGALGDDLLQVSARQAQRRDATEEANLLYVAMTRARDRLVVLGGDRQGTEREHDSFLRMLLDGAREAGRQDDLIGDLSPERSPGGPRPAVAGSWSPGWDMKVWQPPVMRERVRILTPSQIHDAPVPTGQGGGVGGQGEGNVEGMRRGLVVHSLLQAAANRGSMPPGSGPEWEEAAAVFGDGRWAWIFASDGAGWRGLSEVPVIGLHRPAGPEQPEERITGVIDRLILRPGRADIIDFKTNRCAGTPDLLALLVEHYRPQLELYAEVVGKTRPGLKVRAWLLFTDPDLEAGSRLVDLG
ncbi:MAG: UvrD-helicase domain-containing protein [Candidatus Krumholzibacteriia bacterium]